MIKPEGYDIDYAIIALLITLNIQLAAILIISIIHHVAFEKRMRGIKLPR